MADISAQGIPDLGSLMSSYGQGQANIGLTQQQTQTSAAQAQGLTATAGLTKAQTGLVGVQTQKAAFEVQMIKNAMNSLNNLDTGKSEQTGDQSQADPTEVGVASSLNHKFGFVDPMGPPGIQQYINATAWVNPAEAQRASDMRDKMVAGKTQQNQAEANDIFQTAQTLSASDNPHPLSALLNLKPGSYLNNVGQAIASDTTKTPEEKDAAAAQAVQSAAKYSHQYTGRPVDVQGDEYRDKATGFSVSAPKVGLTKEQQVDFGKWSNTPQTVTIDNRETTIKPKDLGIKGPQDVLNNKSVKFSAPPPVGTPPPAPAAPNASGVTPGQPPATPGQAPQPTTPMTPAQARSAPAAQGGSPIPGLPQPQSDFVKNMPPAFPSVPSNEKLSADDLNQRNIYREQAKDLSKASNLEYTRATDVVTHIKQINALLDTPGLKLGPLAPEYAQMQTIFSQWAGTSAGQAGAFQVLSKVLNTTEMNDLLQQFHSEGAQVRLGAYESKLIMDKLTASPALTKEAIQQMLQWQGSDSQYTIQKAKTAGAAVQTGRSVANFDKDYGAQFQKQDIVDTTAKALNPNIKDFSGAKGKTYTQAEVAATAAKLGQPLVMFQDQLTKAGATIK